MLTCLHLRRVTHLEAVGKRCHRIWRKLHGKRAAKALRCLGAVAFWVCWPGHMELG